MSRCGPGEKDRFLLTTSLGTFRPGAHPRGGLQASSVGSWHCPAVGFGTRKGDAADATRPNLPGRSSVADRRASEIVRLVEVVGEVEYPCTAVRRTGRELVVHRRP